MWLYWGEKNSASYKYRGFWPRIDLIPEPYKDVSRWMAYFFDRENCVGGQIMEDFRARQWKITYPFDCYDWNWQLVPEQMELLENLCVCAQTGSYCFDTEAQGCDNCCSWIIKVVNKVMGSGFLPTVQPAWFPEITRKFEDALSTGRRSSFFV